MIETVLLWPCLNADSGMRPFSFPIPLNFIWTITNFDGHNFFSVSKVQHGCIDCLALMICVELQAEESITDSTPDRIRVIGKKGIVELYEMMILSIEILIGSWVRLHCKPVECAAAGSSVVTYVLNQFFNDKKERISIEFGEENCESVAAVPLSFRLCMGNVLISTCQKISESCKKHFAAQVLPCLLHSLKVPLSI